MMTEYSVSRIKAGAALLVAISAEMRLALRIATDRIKMSNPRGSPSRWLARRLDFYRLHARPYSLISAKAHEQVTSRY
ncbi:MAG: hypothetical protein GPOALKHO_000631 [Sodalis sp.]|nr:MAG: hypothetical protein GPOALKHO_000631 [Sodalis sp.]